MRRTLAGNRRIAPSVYRQVIPSRAAQAQAVNPASRLRISIQRSASIFVLRYQLSAPMPSKRSKNPPPGATPQYGRDWYPRHRSRRHPSNNSRTAVPQVICGSAAPALIAREVSTMLRESISQFHIDGRCPCCGLLHIVDPDDGTEFCCRIMRRMAQTATPDFVHRLECKITSSLGRD